MGRRPRLSVNSTLIAGVGTLLLAMGIGVLIGRSGNGNPSSKQASAVQLVTVPGAAASAGATSATGPATPAATAAKPTKSVGSKAAASPSSAAVVKPQKNAPPPTKVVKVGSPGTGPGYQHGKFTGNFFGQ
jgi:hypothetical protein